MNGFVQWMEVKLMPIANKFGSQRHMTAIRKGLIATMPLTIVGSFFTIFQNIPIEAYTKLIEPYQAILDIPSRYGVTCTLCNIWDCFIIGQKL